VVDLFRSNRMTCRRGLLLVALASAFAGCGASALTDGPPEEQISATVNAFFAAWTAADGELACSYLTDRGRVRIVKVVTRALTSLETDDCVTAIESSSSEIEGKIGQVVTPMSVRLESPDRAVVASEFRGEVRLHNVDGRWLLDLPIFVD